MFPAAQGNQTRKLGKGWQKKMYRPWLLLLISSIYTYIMQDCRKRSYLTKVPFFLNLVLHVNLMLIGHMTVRWQSDDLYFLSIFIKTNKIKTNKMYNYGVGLLNTFLALFDSGRAWQQPVKRTRSQKQKWALKCTRVVAKNVLDNLSTTSPSKKNQIAKTKVGWSYPSVHELWPIPCINSTTNNNQ